MLCLMPLAAPAGPPEDLVSLEILPGWDTPQGTRIVGLQFTLAPGWKTYWRAPGDAGIPPLFDWTGSLNIAGADFHWPTPLVFDQAGMRSIGYADRVVIPVEILPGSPGQPQHIAGAVEIGVCDDICVPVRLTFAADLLPGGRRDPGIVAAMVDQPMPADRAGVQGVTCTAEPTEDGLRLTAHLTLPATGAPEVVVIEVGDPAVWVSESATNRMGDVLTAEVKMIHVRGGAIALDRSTLRFTVLGSDRAVDITGCDAG